MSIWQAKPWDLARQISEDTGTRVIAVRDGMEFDLAGLETTRKPGALVGAKADAALLPVTGQMLSPRFGQGSQQAEHYIKCKEEQQEAHYEGHNKKVEQEHRQHEEENRRREMPSPDEFAMMVYPEESLVEQLRCADDGELRVVLWIFHRL